MTTYDYRAIIDKQKIQPDDLPPELQEVADLIGFDNVLVLVLARGGESLYIPKPERIAAAARNRAIRAQFNGRNYRELAARHNLTVTWVREILSEDRKDKQTRPGNQKQLDLF
jgi:Mor family transcriptional regulator